MEAATVASIFIKKLFMDLFAPNHIILILLVILLLFGGKKIPELMRGLGKGVREFNDAKQNVRKEMENENRDREKDVPSPASSTLTNTSPS